MLKEVNLKKFKLIGNKKCIDPDVRFMLMILEAVRQKAFKVDTPLNEVLLHIWRGHSTDAWLKHDIRPVDKNKVADWVLHYSLIKSQVPDDLTDVMMDYAHYSYKEELQKVYLEIFETLEPAVQKIIKKYNKYYFKDYLPKLMKKEKETVA